MEAIETTEHRGYTLELHYDPDPMDPREDDNVGTMVCWHPRYNLGDEQYRAGDYTSAEEVREAIENAYNVAAILPLGLYDHSGISMYVGGKTDPWDSGQVGWIYCTHEQVAEEWPNVLHRRDGDPEPLERAESYLRGEVEDYDRYLRGEAYGFVVQGPDGFYDSCWGFPTTEDATAEGLGVLNYAADQAIRTSPSWWVRMYSHSAA